MKKIIILFCLLLFCAACTEIKETKDNEIRNEITGDCVPACKANEYCYFTVDLRYNVSYDKCFILGARGSWCQFNFQCKSNKCVGRCL